MKKPTITPEDIEAFIDGFDELAKRAEKAEELVKIFNETEEKKEELLKKYQKKSSAIEKPTYKTLEFCKKETYKFINELIKLKEIK